MRRWIAASMGVLFLMTVFVASSVNLQAADKTVTGTVSAVAPDSITIKGKEAEVKLTVDAKTKVVGTGMGTKTEKMKEEKKSTQITDLLKTGDQVSAKYDEASNHASEVRLVKAAAAAK
jgi:type 1 fimbria pilin